ncbi:MAG: hypothetical protein ACRC10_10215 [Thermoguttaceae bacterium]
MKILFFAKLVSGLGKRYYTNVNSFFEPHLKNGVIPQTGTKWTFCRNAGILPASRKKGGQDARVPIGKQTLSNRLRFIVILL